MVYTASVIPKGQKVEMESLPIATIENYPLEKRDYKPYAQAIFVVNESSVYIRLMSFELQVESQSKIGFVLYPFEDESYFISLWAHKDSKPKCHLNSGDDIPIISRIYNGEDLQGVYWGHNIEIPIADLEKIAKTKLTPGNTLLGNFYKISQGEKAHYGSYFPADFSKDIHSKDNMGNIKLVDY